MKKKGFEPRLSILKIVKPIKIYEQFNPIAIKLEPTKIFHSMHYFSIELGICNPAFG